MLEEKPWLNQHDWSYYHVSCADHVTGETWLLMWASLEAYGWCEQAFSYQSRSKWCRFPPFHLVFKCSVYMNQRVMQGLKSPVGSFWCKGLACKRVCGCERLTWTLSGEPCLGVTGGGVASDIQRSTSIEKINHELIILFLCASGGLCICVHMWVCMRQTACRKTPALFHNPGLQAWACEQTNPPYLRINNQPGHKIIITHDVVVS